MKVSVTGSGGFLGSRIKRALIARGAIVQDIDYPDNDIGSYQSIKQTLMEFSPDVIVHTAAMGDIWRCEQNKDAAYRINIGGTRNIASVCADLGIHLVSVSSDQVYDYESLNFINEYTALSPLNFYGMTKVEGEKIVQTLVPKHHIVRLAWQFGVHEEGLPDSRDGLFEKILDAYHNQKTLYYTENAYQNINFVYDTIDAILAMVYGEVPYGIYNVTCENEMTEKDTISYMLKKLGASDLEIGVLLKEKDGGKPFDLRAEPLNLKLGGYQMPTFLESFERCLKLYQSIESEGK